MNFIAKPAAVLVFGMAAIAHAQSTDNAQRLFAEVGYSTLSIKNSETQAKASPGLLTLSLGYRFNPYLALEGQLGAGIQSSKVKNPLTAGDYRLKANSYGVYLRPTYPVNDAFELFGRLGYSRIALKETDKSAPGYKWSDSDSSLSYGVGFNYRLSKTSYLQASWTASYKKKEIKGTSLGFAYGMNF